jgi:hypothetical protein
MQASRRKLPWPTTWCTTIKLQHKHHLRELALCILSRRPWRCSHGHLGCQVWLLRFLPTHTSNWWNNSRTSIVQSSYFQMDLNINLPTSEMKASKSTPGYIQCSTDNNKEEIHCNSYMTFMVPAMNWSTLVCNKYEISCSESWEDAGMKAQCEAYTASVCSRPKKYRNRYCMLWNNVDVPEPCFYGGQYLSTTPSFTTLLDWRRLNREGCASSAVYDLCLP